MSLGKQQNNFAFIDGTNLHMTFEYLDWKIDYGKLRIYLRKRRNITKAYYFIGYIEKNNRLYANLKAWGYVLKHRQVTKNKVDPVICPNCQQVVEPERIRTKCDCDADLTLQVMDDINDYHKAILISSDGDFDNLVKKLLEINKLKLVLAPCKQGCSRLLKSAAQGRIAFLDSLRNQLEKT